MVSLRKIAEQAGVGILIDETAVPVRPEVLAVCETLGIDTLYLANEGKTLIFVKSIYSNAALAVLHGHRYGADARVIGKVTASPAGKVGLRTAIGGVRLLDMLVGDQLPRIC